MATPCTIVVLVFAIGFAQSDVYKDLPFGRLLNKFTNVVDNMKANNGVISDTDKATLEQLKKDMVEDCKAGKLQVYTGGQKYDVKNTHGIPTNVYHVRLSEEATRDTYYWALPEVDCNGLDGRVNYKSDDELEDEDDSDSESGGSGSEASAGAEKQGRAKPGLAGDDEISGFINKEHHRMDEENKKDKVSLKGVKKPPNPNKIHVQ